MYQSYLYFTFLTPGLNLVFGFDYRRFVYFISIVHDFSFQDIYEDI